MRSWTGDAGLKTAMKRRIYLFRHGKSSWGGSAREDKDRDLNPRGRKAAEKMGEWCAENGVAPDLVLCSTATRTRETLARLLPRLKSAARIEFEDALYLADAHELTARLRRLGGATRAVMVIGHNPGLHELACLLAGDGEAEDLARLNGKFPTAALAELSAELKTWRELAPHRCILDRFVLPRELP